MNSISGQRTIPSWYQEVIESFDIDSKLDTLSDEELINIQCECNTLKDTIYLASESKKRLSFVLGVLSPRAAVYPIIKGSVNLLTNLIENVEQLHLKAEKKIILDEQKVDWNLLVELKNNKLLPVGRMKSVQPYSCSKGVKHMAEKRKIRLTRKDFLIIFISAIVILFDPFGLFPLM